MNISLDLSTYEKLRGMQRKYGFKNLCELMVAMAHILAARVEETGKMEYDLPEDDGVYIEAIFDELGDWRRGLAGAVPIRHNNKKLK